MVYWFSGLFKIVPLVNVEVVKQQKSSILKKNHFLVPP